MVEFVNLTPHPLNIHDDEGNLVILPSSGKVRVKANYTRVNTIRGVDIYTCEYGQVEGLPAPKNGVLYIVSGLIKNAVPHRKDILAPGELVRNEVGQPIGCRGLRQ